MRRPAQPLPLGIEPVGAGPVPGGNGSGPAATFFRIDPATNQVAGTPVPIGRPLPATDSWPTAIAAGHTGLWVLDFSRNLLYHLALRPARA